MLESPYRYVDHALGNQASGCIAPIIIDSFLGGRYLRQSKYRDNALQQERPAFENPAIVKSMVEHFEIDVSHGSIVISAEAFLKHTHVAQADI